MTDIKQLREDVTMLRSRLKPEDKNLAGVVARFEALINVVEELEKKEATQ